MPLLPSRTSRLAVALVATALLTLAAATRAGAQAEAPPRDRLFLPDSTLAELRAAVAADTGLLADYYRRIRRRAEGYPELPDVGRELEGFRMLGLSRRALRVLTDAALVAVVEDDARYLELVDRQLIALVEFEDWNPGHFLDVGELALGVAVALDWVGDRLPLAHRARVEGALFRHVLVPGRADHWWLASPTNWNQVCFTGILAAAYVLAGPYPQTAERELERALDYMDHGLAAYAPDGVYPEGVSYWVYGTSFSVLGFEILRRWRGEAFGLEEEDGFHESAAFATACMGPRGQAYDFGDGFLSGVLGGYGTLAWFACELRDRSLLSATGLLREASSTSTPGRLAALHLPWIAGASRLPVASAGEPREFAGGGLNPVAVARSPTEPSFFLGVKGGSADVNHGQMDAGSFVFELDGVRWGVDLGVRAYEPFEAAGIDLWDRSQDGERWDLIDKNNLGHSTVSVAGARHRVDGFAPLGRDAVTGEIRVALDSVLGGPVASWTRSFTPGAASLRIRDEYVLDSAGTVVWQWLTDSRAIRVSPGELLLRSVARGPDARLPCPGGRTLRLRLTQPGQRFEGVTLSPSDDPYGMRWPGLRRLEVRVEGEAGERGAIEVMVERG